MTVIPRFQRPLPFFGLWPSSSIFKASSSGSGTAVSPSLTTGRFFTFQYSCNAAEPMPTTQYNLSWRSVTLIPAGKSLSLVKWHSHRSGSGMKTLKEWEGSISLPATQGSHSACPHTVLYYGKAWPQSHLSPGNILDSSWSKGRYSGLRGAAMELCLVSLCSFIWAQDFLLPHLLWHNCRPLSNLLNSSVYLTTGHLLLGPPVSIILWDERQGLTPRWPHACGVKNELPGSIWACCLLTGHIPAAWQVTPTGSGMKLLTSVATVLLCWVYLTTGHPKMPCVVLCFFLSRAQFKIKHYISFIYVSLISFNLKYFLHLSSFPLTWTFLDGISFLWV